MTKWIWFDMDGTIANLYAVENWLADLRAERTRPYDMAQPMVNFSLFARLLHQLQADGWKVGIISWTAKSGSEAYNMAVEMAKRAWLARHLPSVEWDEIKVVRYGTDKLTAPIRFLRGEGVCAGCSLLLMNLQPALVGACSSLLCTSFSLQ